MLLGSHPIMGSEDFMRSSGELAFWKGLPTAEQVAAGGRWVAAAFEGYGGGGGIDELG